MLRIDRGMVCRESLRRLEVGVLGRAPTGWLHETPLSIRFREDDR